MALYTFTELSNNQEIAFNPGGTLDDDDLVFYGTTIVPGQLRFSVVNAPGEENSDVNDLLISVASGPDAGKQIYLLNVTPDMLSNNDFGWDYGGFVIVGDNEADGEDDGANMINGTSSGDLLMGLGGNDSISGSGGDDYIDGGTNDGYGDTMAGGNGDDTYVVDSALDVVNETMEGSSGTDTAMVSVNWTMATGVEKAVMTGGANQSVTGNTAANTITGNGVANTVHAGGGGDAVIGKGGADKLWGGGGNDTIQGNAGIDSLWGDAGNDAFLFNSAGGAANADTIKDFVHLTDDIVIDKAFFGAIGVMGDLAAGKFKAASDITATGGATVDSSDRVLYDKDSGSLYYDSNGSASGGRVLLGTVWSDATHHPTLTAADFKVIDSAPV